MANFLFPTQPRMLARVLLSFFLIFAPHGVDALVGDSGVGARGYEEPRDSALASRAQIVVAQECKEENEVSETEREDARDSLEGMSNGNTFQVIIDEQNPDTAEDRLHEEFGFGAFIGVMAGFPFALPILVLSVLFAACCMFPCWCCCWLPPAPGCCPWWMPWEEKERGKLHGNGKLCAVALSIAFAMGIALFGLQANLSTATIGTGFDTTYCAEAGLVDLTISGEPASAGSDRFRGLLGLLSDFWDIRERLQTDSTWYQDLVTKLLHFDGIEKAMAGLTTAQNTMASFYSQSALDAAITADNQHSCLVCTVMADQINYFANALSSTTAGALGDARKALRDSLEGDNLASTRDSFDEVKNVLSDMMKAMHDYGDPIISQESIDIKNQLSGAIGNSGYSTMLFWAPIFLVGIWIEYQLLENDTADDGGYQGPKKCMSCCWLCSCFGAVGMLAFACIFVVLTYPLSNACLWLDAVSGSHIERTQMAFNDDFQPNKQLRDLTNTCFTDAGSGRLLDAIEAQGCKEEKQPGDSGYNPAIVSYKYPSSCENEQTITMAEKIDGMITGTMNDAFDAMGNDSDPIGMLNDNAYFKLLVAISNYGIDTLTMVSLLDVTQFARDPRWGIAYVDAATGVLPANGKAAVDTATASQLTGNSRLSLGWPHSFAGKCEDTDLVADDTVMPTIILAQNGGGINPTNIPGWGKLVQAALQYEYPGGGGRSSQWTDQDTICNAPSLDFATGSDWCATPTSAEKEALYTQCFTYYNTVAAPGASSMPAVFASVAIEGDYFGGDPIQGGAPANVLECNPCRAIQNIVIARAKMTGTHTFPAYEAGAAKQPADTLICPMVAADAAGVNPCEVQAGINSGTVNANRPSVPQFCAQSYDASDGSTYDAYPGMGPCNGGGNCNSILTWSPDCTFENPAYAADPGQPKFLVQMNDARECSFFYTSMYTHMDAGNHHSPLWVNGVRRSSPRTPQWNTAFQNKVDYGRLTAITLQHAVNRVDVETPLVRTTINSQVRSHVFDGIITPIRDVILNGISCKYMNTTYRKILDGMCFQSLVGLDTYGGALYMLGVVLGLYGYFLFYMWKRTADNISQARKNGGARAGGMQIVPGQMVVVMAPVVPK